MFLKIIQVPPRLLQGVNFNMISNSLYPCMDTTVFVEYGGYTLDHSVVEGSDSVFLVYTIGSTFDI